MGKLAINNKGLNKYFALLNQLDDSAKKKLIIKLTESLETKTQEPNLQSLFGAWEDNRDADTINKEIRNSRVDSRIIENFDN